MRRPVNTLARGLKLSVLAGLLASGAVQAASFAEIFASARENDAQYRAASFDLESARQGVPIARSALLPAIGLNYSRSDVSGTRQFYNGLNQENQVQLNYVAPTTSLAMRVPVFNKEARARYEQSQVQADAAELVYRARGLELMDRTGTAYLQVLLAYDAKGLAESQLVSVQGQLTRAEQRLKRGEGTRIDQALAQAAADVAKVKVLEAEDQIQMARRGLKRLTARDTPPLNQTTADFLPTEITPNGIGEWIALAEQNSPTIRAKQQALMAARLGVERQSAGHYPRVDLVASIARSENESLNNLGQTSVLKSLGVQVSVPIFNGGGVNAGVKQALADASRIEEEIRVERESVQMEIQRNYQPVANGGNKIDAYRRAVDSSEVAYRGSVRSQEAGLGTTADVLDAQARLYSAKRDLAQARYDYLLARVRLMINAGLPLEEVASDLDRNLPVAIAAKP